MHPENAIDNGDFIKILVYKFILNIIFVFFGVSLAIREVYHRII